MGRSILATKLGLPGPLMFFLFSECVSEASLPFLVEPSPLHYFSTLVLKHILFLCIPVPCSVRGLHSYEGVVSPEARPLPRAAAFWPHASQVGCAVPMSTLRGEVRVPFRSQCLPGCSPHHMPEVHLGCLPAWWPSASNKGLDKLSVGWALRLFTTLPVLK